MSATDYDSCSHGSASWREDDSSPLKHCLARVLIFPEPSFLEQTVGLLDEFVFRHAITSLFYYLTSGFPSSPHGVDLSVQILDGLLLRDIT